MTNSVRLTHYYIRHLLSYLDQHWPGHDIKQPQPHLSFRGYQHNLEDFNQVAADAERRSRDALFTLTVARRSLPPGHGLLGLLIQACATLSEACLLGHQLQRLSRSGLFSQVTVSQQEINAVFDSNAFPPEQISAFIEYCMGNYFSIANALSGSGDFRAERISFRHAPRATIKRYQQLLPCHQICFNQPQDAISIARPVMDISLLSADRQGKILLLEEARKRLLEVSGEHLLSVRIAEQLQARPDCLSGFSLANCAALLNISASTLKRRLQRENTSFQRLLNDARLRHASSLLKTTDKTIACIARESGFSGSSAFSRAFRRQYQVSAQVYRHQVS